MPCNLISAARDTPTESLVSDAAQEMLRNTTELDYMTHIVFRMYENKRWGHHSKITLFILLTSICTVQLFQLKVSKEFLQEAVKVWRAGIEF